MVCDHGRVSAASRTARRGGWTGGVALAVALLAALVLAGCGQSESTSSPPAGLAGTGAPASDATTAAPAPPPSTAAPTTTTTAPAPTGPTTPTAPGDHGTEVSALQWRLLQLGYFVVDDPGSYGTGTRHAVMAFQKESGLQRDGIAGPRTVAALASATPVVPRDGGGRHLEVDLAAQVLLVVDEQGRAVAVNATTGRPGMDTPPGTFSIFRQVDGWDHGPLGDLFRPKYFNRGIAVHGGPPVGAVPASHGCVRVPDAAINWIWDSNQAPPGTRVVVY